jgi:hypothetical protein
MFLKVMDSEGVPHLLRIETIKEILPHPREDGVLIRLMNRESAFTASDTFESICERLGGHVEGESPGIQPG